MGCAAGTAAGSAHSALRCAGGPPLIFLDEPCALYIPHSIVCEMAAMPAGQPPRGPPNGGPACLPRRSRWGQTCCSCGGGRGECTAEVSVSQVSRLWVGQGTAPWLLRHCCQPVVGHFHLSQQLKSGCCRQWMLLTIMGPGDQPNQPGVCGGSKPIWWGLCLLNPLPCASVAQTTCRRRVRPERAQISSSTGEW
jgi:hypothetical protein